MNTHLKWWFFVVVLFGPAVLLAQGKAADLQAELHQAKDDHTRVDLLNKLAFHYRKSQPDSAWHYAEESIELAQSISYPEGEAMAWNRKGLALKYQGKYLKSLDTYHEALLLVKDEKSDQAKETRALTYRNLTNTHRHLGNLTRALEYCLKEVEIWQQFTPVNHRRMAASYNNLANLYAADEAYKKAIDYYHKAIEVYEESGDDFGIAQAYTNLGNALQFLDSLEPAKDYYQRALVMFMDMNADFEASTIYMNLGVIAEKEGDYAKAKQYFTQDLELHIRLNNPAFQAEAYRNLAMTEVLLNQPDTALNHLKNALKLAQETEQAWLEAEILQQLSETNESIQDFQLATHYLKHYIQLRDSLTLAESSEERIAMQEKFEAEQKERQIALLEAENALQESSLEKQNLIYGLLGTLTLLITLFALVLRTRLRTKAQLAEKESALNRQELRVRNALLEGQEMEKRRFADLLHDNITGMLFSLKLQMVSLLDSISAQPEPVKKAIDPNYQRLETSLKDLLTQTIDDIRELSKGLVPPLLVKFGLEPALKDLAKSIEKGGNLKVNLEIEDLESRPEANLELAIYRMVQELLLNALRHSGASEVTVSLVKQNGELEVQVSDNGQGFDTEQARSGPGEGLNNIWLQLDFYKGKMLLNTSYGKGTAYQLLIPLTSKSA